jgi:hypothetical protein
MKRKKTNITTSFYCFTPFVSLATFLIEFLFAIYVVARYKLNNFNRLAVLLLIFLGLFQFSEYMMCRTDQVVIWGKIGIASITMLPVLGLHLITYLTHKSRWLQVGYFLVGFTLFTVFFQEAGDFRCVQTFVTLYYDNLYDLIYTFYYFGFLIVGLFLLLKDLSKEKMYYTERKWMTIGYASFILPTAILYAFSQIGNFAIPSVMCGFALLFAIILVFKIIPDFNKTKK